MDEAEFDKFADEYREQHADSIKASGESPEFFAGYKVRETARLAQRAGLPAASRILDFGSGVGNSVPYFRRHLPRCDLTCLDVSRRSLAVSEERFPGQASYVAFDGLRIPFPDGSFDLVFSACVHHHIPHEQHAGLLAEWHRVLRPGGMAVIFEHNPYNPLTVRVVKACEFDENAVLVRAGTLKKKLKDAGFVSVRKHYRIFFPRILRLLRPLEPLLTWLPLGAQYDVAARKAGQP